MDIGILIYILHLAFVANIPPSVSADMYLAAEQHQVDRYDLAATLISERSSKYADFSLLGSKLDGITWDWDPAAKGDKGETGLFQVAGRWADLAGHKRNQLTDPAVNVQVGAYTLAAAFQSHAKCSKHSNHTVIAHWKCNRDFRDTLSGGCRFAQAKWTTIRHSLTRFWPVHTGKHISAHYKEAEERFQQAQRRHARKVRRKARRQERKASVALQAGD